MRFAGCVEESFQLRAPNSTVTDTLVKALRSACRMHTPDVVYPAFKDVTQLWWAPGDNGVPALINSAISRIENEFIDVRCDHLRPAAVHAPWPLTAPCPRACVGCNRSSGCTVSRATRRL